jgi:hypothetical protein
MGIWNAYPYFNISGTQVSSIVKLSSTKTESNSFQAFEKIEWEEDYNDEIAHKLAGAIPTNLNFSKTTSLKFKVTSQPFNRIRSFFPPLYLLHCIYRI